MMRFINKAHRLNLSPHLARGEVAVAKRSVAGAGEGRAPVLSSSFVLADRKSPSPYPSPRKNGERENAASLKHLSLVQEAPHVVT